MNRLAGLTRSTTARRWALLVATGALLLFVAWLLRDYRGGGELQAWHRVAVHDVSPESGFAFRTRLPAGAPNEKHGAVQAVVLEDGAVTGQTSDHDSIRQQGSGRFSFWDGTLYFSATDNSDPRSNGRRYEVAWPSELGTSAEWATRWAGRGSLLGSVLVLLLAALRRIPRRTRLRLALVPMSTLVALGAAEGWLRVRYPFAKDEAPGQFDARFGFNAKPDTVCRRTNLFDFCVEQRSNSLGFLDREPRPRDPATPRIIVLGDSFVEAVQLPIAKKFPALLEDRLHARGVKATTEAFGVSGCGTSNEIPFYEQFGRCRPGDLVVLLLVSNDIANNSAVLESLRQGWHPRHLPRLFFVRGANGEFERLPIDPDWKRYRLPAAPVDSVTPPPSALAQWLGWSRLYQWLDATQAWIQETSRKDYDARVIHRLAILRQDPALAAQFEDWRFPDDADIDGMTASVDSPLAFREAVAATAYAIHVLHDEVTKDGGKLLVVACHHLAVPPEFAAGRKPAPKSWLGYFATICEQEHLPLLDLHEKFRDYGVLNDVTWVRDAHWNALGHASAARAIDEYLQANPQLLSR